MCTWYSHWIFGQFPVTKSSAWFIFCQIRLQGTLAAGYSGPNSSLLSDHTHINTKTDISNSAGCTRHTVSWEEHYTPHWHEYIPACWSLAHNILHDSVRVRRAGLSHPHLIKKAQREIFHLLNCVLLCLKWTCSLQSPFIRFCSEGFYYSL